MAMRLSVTDLIEIANTTSTPTSMRRGDLIEAHLERRQRQIPSVLREEPVNVPLLRKCVEWVEEQAMRPKAQREWDNDMWTGRNHAGRRTHCVGSYACLISGYRFVDDETLVTNGTDSQIESVGEVAARLLGLQRHEAFELFRSDQTAHGIRVLAEHIAGERL